MDKKDKNRKTTIPVKSLPAMVEWLMKNCNQEEIVFMAALAGNRQNFKILTNIFTRLTDYNVHTVFYENVKTEQELMVFRAAKRGEVAGLKAFAMTCQAAREEVKKRKELENAAI